MRAEPSLDLDEDSDEDEEDETPATRPAPMFDTDPAGAPLVAATDPEPARQMPRRHVNRQSVAHATHRKGR